MTDGRVLFREFLRSPTRTATLTASSDALVAAMIAPLPLDGDPVVVELGAGTGRVTDALQRRLAGRGRQIAVELNPVLADRLAARLPRVTVISGDAGQLPDLLAAHGVERVDGVASLLPWAAHAAAPVSALAAGVLAPGVCSRRRRCWGCTCSRPRSGWCETCVRRSPRSRSVGPVWGNLPPARVLVGRTHR